MLTQRQIQTLANLKRVGLETPEEVIAWCEAQLKLPIASQKKSLTGRRKHGRAYYKEIIDFLCTN